MGTNLHGLGLGAVHSLEGFSSFLFVWGKWEQGPPSFGWVFVCGLLGSPVGTVVVGLDIPNREKRSSDRGGFESGVRGW